MVSRKILRTCHNCQRRPGFFGYIVYRCKACHRFCCDHCVVRGLFAIACPHCGSRWDLEQVGYTR